MTVIDEIAAERRRQINAEGWSPEHDDQHHDGELARAAAAYAFAGAADAAYRRRNSLRLFFGKADNGEATTLGVIWPWNASWWKPKSQRRDLIRAAALIIAEIERLDRASTLQTTDSAEE